jgi:hypothetical protein
VPGQHVRGIRDSLARVGVLGGHTVECASSIVAGKGGHEDRRTPAKLLDPNLVGRLRSQIG